ncbi:MAG: glutamyl-tRNA reductase [Clostridiales bacterium]|nr:glutamyl-tRNA reductase [Clostridiales bacterium]
MQLGMIGINYKQAPLDVRDRTSFTENTKIEFLQQMEANTHPAVTQCMILSTCNRSEIYFFYEEEEQFSQMSSFYTEWFTSEVCSPYLVSCKGEEAVAYLYRTAAGLESMVLGEDQILGQVGEALDFARTLGYAKKEMNKVVRDAITCAKKLKTELKISEVPLSVSYIGILQVEKTLGIRGKTAAVIGLGKVSRLALKYLDYYGADKIIVCTRAVQRVKELKEEYPQVEAAEYSARYEAIEASDIVISATAAPHVILTRAEYAANCDTARPRVFLDLAAPRDVEQELEQEAGVTLINMDTLHQLSQENRKERERLVALGKEEMRQEVAQTMEWLFASRMDGTIESLQKRCAGIVEDSFTYLDRKLDLTPREQKLVKKILNASLQRLLREPIHEMKTLESPREQEDYRHFVEQLFQL